MSEHVDEATWERLAMTELAAADRAATLEHVMTCERCRTIYRGLTALETSARDAGLLETPVPGRSRRWWGGGVAAVAAAAALVLWWRWPDARLGDPLRGSTDPTVELVAPAGDPRGPGALSWQPVAGATRYRVEVFGATGQLVWQRDVTALSASWPDDAPRTAGSYRWRVIASGAAGELARSKLAPLDLAP